MQPIMSFILTHKLTPTDRPFALFDFPLSSAIFDLEEEKATFSTLERREKPSFLFSEEGNDAGWIRDRPDGPN